MIFNQRAQVVLVLDFLCIEVSSEIRDFLKSDSKVLGVRSPLSIDHTLLIAPLHFSDLTLEPRDFLVLFHHTRLNCLCMLSSDLLYMRSVI